jgi:hypothetical protein
VACRLAHSTPDVGPQTHPCFLSRGVDCASVAPSTHQAQGLLTSRWPAPRRPLAPVVPQKTVGALPCPSVDGAPMPWLPCGSRFQRAHGRGGARLHHPVGGPLSGVEGRTHHTPGYEPFFLPVSHPTPTAGATAAKRFVDLTGPQVAPAVLARPRQCMGHWLPCHHQRALRLLPWGKPRPSRAEADGQLGRRPIGPLQRRVAICAVALAFPLPLADFGTLHPAAV